MSYALNGRPGVSEQTRLRVQAVADRLGWRASQAARSLSRSQADAVGLILTRPASLLAVEPFYMEFIAGIEGVIAEHGMALMFQVSRDNAAEEDTYRRWWAQRRIDGVFVVDVRVDDRRIALVRELGIPAVYVGIPVVYAQDDDGAPGDAYVWTDDATAMRAAVQHLVDLGHRRIGHVTGVPSYLHIAVRDTTFRTVMAELGLEAQNAEADFSGEAGARATRGLLSSPHPPTAIIYDNDIMAVASLGVAADLGLDVPGDVSLLAWDDSPLCEITHPALSAMHRDVTTFGADAAVALLGVIEGNKVANGTERKVAISVLVTRGSTGHPRGH